MRGIIGEAAIVYVIDTTKPRQFGGFLPVEFLCFLARTLQVVEKLAEFLGNPGRGIIR